jgi:hypothetical protein
MSGEPTVQATRYLAERLTRRLRLLPARRPIAGRARQLGVAGDRGLRQPAVRARDAHRRLLHDERARRVLLPRAHGPPAGRGPCRGAPARWWWVAATAVRSEELLKLPRHAARAPGRAGRRRDRHGPPMARWHPPRRLRRPAPGGCAWATRAPSSKRQGGEERFDQIVLDLTDPLRPAVELYTVRVLPAACRRRAERPAACCRCTWARPMHSPAEPWRASPPRCARCSPSCGPTCSTCRCTARCGAMAMASDRVDPLTLTAAPGRRAAGRAWPDRLAALRRRHPPRAAQPAARSSSACWPSRRAPWSTATAWTTRAWTPAPTGRCDWCATESPQADPAVGVNLTFAQSRK